MAFRPAPYSQLDGSAFQHANCVLATCTDLIDRATVGALRIAAPVLRKASGDTSGGVTYEQAAATVLRVTSAKGRPVRLVPRYGLSRTQVRDLAKAGYAYGISGWTGVTKDTRFRTGTFIGGHTVYVQGWRDGYFEVEDPGTTAAGYMLWPEDLLFRFAEARGGGLINVLVAPDTEDVDRTAVLGVAVRTKPDMTAPIVPIGNLQVDVKYHVIRTLNGGTWARPGGGTANGWHQLNLGFVRGPALR